MKRVTLDFETYYDPASGYSLKNMSTEDYVCDPRAETISVAAKVDDGPERWMTGTKEEIKAWLDALDIPNSALCAHHAMFDALWLAVHFDIYPAFIICTESMVRPFLKPLLKSLSLASVSEYLGLGKKGDEVVRAMGKRRLDFTPYEMEQYGGVYGCNDVGLCDKIYRWARARLPADELRILDDTLQMYIRPQLVADAEVFRAGLTAVRKKKAEVLAELEVQGITAATLRSSEKFAQVLRDRGIDPPMKDSLPSLKRGDVPVKRTYAFAKADPEFIELREDFEHDIDITMILNARLSEKSTQEEDRNLKFLNIAERYGWLRVPLGYYNAHTGRYGGIEGYNMQNPPNVGEYRDKDGQKKYKSHIRFGFKAPDDHVVLAADLSQIEARIVAALAGQNDLVEEFRLGQDVYSSCAAGLFKREVSKKLAATEPRAKKDRDSGKIIILGCGFGMGPPKFKRQTRKDGLNLSDQEAFEYVNYYRSRYEMIPAYWYKWDAALRDLVFNDMPTTMGPVTLRWADRAKRLACIDLPNGLQLWYPELKWDDKQKSITCRHARDKFPRRLWGGVVTENVVQALARIVVMWHAVMIRKELGLRMALQVHDELVYVVRKALAAELQAKVVAIMSRSPPWMPDLPVAVESKIGNSFGDV